MTNSIHIEAERRTRMMFATKVRALSSREGVNAQKHIVGSLPVGRYYPKRTDFSQISEQDLQAVIRDTNNQPRKCLG